MESEGWDGRFGIVVAADIASYARGPARSTSGCGAVAVLIGRDAPLAFSNPKEKVTHASHVWDFYKPDHTVEYPTVDGALSQVCYYQALEDCYVRFVEKMERIHREEAMTNGEDESFMFDAESAEYFVFHAPYNKLVQKSYARLYLLDARRKYEFELEKEEEKGYNHPLRQWLEKPITETYTNKTLEKELKKLSTPSFNKRLSDANATSKLIGNTYAASVFMGIASLIDKLGREASANDESVIDGKKVVVFSYGSGAMASLYRLHTRASTCTTEKFTISNMSKVLNLPIRLSSRVEVDAKELDEVMDCREAMHRSGCPKQNGQRKFVPVYCEKVKERLWSGTYYLVEMDDKFRRTYARLP